MLQGQRLVESKIQEGICWKDRKRLKTGMLETEIMEMAGM